jgi:hypothetical protein
MTSKPCCRYCGRKLGHHKRCTRPIRFYTRKPKLTVRPSELLAHIQQALKLSEVFNQPPTPTIPVKDYRYQLKDSIKVRSANARWIITATRIRDQSH